MKGILLIFVTLISSIDAFPETPDNEQRPVIAGRPPAIEAVVVREPLQQRSAAYQRLCRSQLLAQLNRILETRDTQRGLIVMVPESLLATNKDTLSPDVSKRLAKIAELMPPDVTVRVEGYTDERGSASGNQDASYRRAEVVRDVLMANDRLPRQISAGGFVYNAPASGHANRRVEIIISGQGIGQAALAQRTWPRSM